MSTSISTTRGDDNGTPQSHLSISYTLRLSAEGLDPMSIQPVDAPGALQDPLQRRMALDLAARFNPTSHDGFVPQALTGMTSFPLYSPDDPMLLRSTSSPPPGAAAIYQEYSREEPQNRGYDVDVSRFLRHWSRDSEYLRARGDTTGNMISANTENLRISPRPAHIRASDWKGDRGDMQGFDWANMGTTRASARAARLRYCDAVHMEPVSSAAGDAQTRLNALAVDLFRFRRMNTRHRAWIEHFQLRNALAVASSADILYLSRDKAHRTDPLGSPSTVVMDLTCPGAQLNGTLGFGNTALAVSSGVVVTGSKYGQYAMTSLAARHGSKPIVGLVNTKDAAICHIEMFRRRGQSRPSTIAFASNDETVSLLDCATNKFLSRFTYGHAINCTSADPHGQMRLVAGDSKVAYVTAADSGQVLEELSHHTADIHATSWSSNGIHLATAAEDHRVLVYDARNWSKPIADIACETACPRSLKFSPSGASSPSLLIAEAEDVVSVVDATAGLFNRKQDIEFFGAVAGVDWRPDGGAFWVTNADAHFGGLMEFERNSARFVEADAVGSRLEMRNERARATQHERRADGARQQLNERKRSSWQISSSPEPVEGGAGERAVLGKRRSLQVLPSVTVAAPSTAGHESASSTEGVAGGGEPVSPQQRYIQRVQRTRTRGISSRARQGLGRMLNP